LVPIRLDHSVVVVVVEAAGERSTQAQVFGVCSAVLAAAVEDQITNLTTMELHDRVLQLAKKAPQTPVVVVVVDPRVMRTVAKMENIREQTVAMVVPVS
jgi:orotidine-5'-phosphate decarboxylase